MSKRSCRKVNFWFVVLLAVIFVGCATAGTKVTSIREVEEQLKKEWQAERTQIVDTKTASSAGKIVDGAIDVALGLAWGVAALLNPVTAIDGIQTAYMAMGTADGAGKLVSGVQEKDAAIILMDFKHDVVLVREVGSEKYSIVDVVKAIFESKQIELKYPFDFNLTDVPQKSKVYHDASGNKLKVTRQIRLTVKCKVPDSPCTKANAEEVAQNFADILAKRLVEETLK